MPIATPEIYAQMLDRAKAGAFAYPAINVSSSQTLIGAIRGFAEAESDGIVQISWGGAEYLSGSTVKNMVVGAVALAEFAHIVAKNYKVNIGIHTDHCPAEKLDGFIRPLQFTYVGWICSLDAGKYEYCQGVTREVKSRRHYFGN
jgi:fructose-bisphosphate aldolase class II